MTEHATAGKPDPVLIAESAVGAMLLRTMTDHLAGIRTPWDQLSTIDQDQVIERFRRAIQEAIRAAMGVLAAGEYPAIVASLDGLSLRKGISAKLTIQKSAHNRHELLDAVGTDVLIVLADPEVYSEELEGIRAKAKQRDLFSEPENLPDIPDYEGEGLPQEAAPLPDEQGDPEPDAEDDDENWIDVSTFAESKEVNKITNATRRGRRGLIEDLLARVEAVNMDSSRDSITYDSEEVSAASRRQLLAALQWIDAYRDDAATPIPKPDLLRYNLAPGATP